MLWDLMEPVRPLLTQPQAAERVSQHA
jgi:hypothetical protein